MLPIYNDVSARRITSLWGHNTCATCNSVPEGMYLLCSLLPVRECSRNEIGTEISVNVGEGKFGCIMVQTKGHELCT